MQIHAAGLPWTAPHRAGSPSRAEVEKSVVDIEAQGGKFFEERSWVGRKLTGEQYAEISARDALKALQTEKPENLFCQPKGDTMPGRIASLATLAAIETLYGKREPSSALANALRNLYDAGYTVERDSQPRTRLQAYDDAVAERYLTVKGPTNLGGSWFSKPEMFGLKDFFHVSHDKRSLPDGDYAEALVQLQKDGRVADAEQAFREGAPVLYHHGIPVARIQERNRKGVDEAMRHAAQGMQLADQHLMPLVNMGRLKPDDAGPLLEAARRPDVEIGALMKLADASLAHGHGGAWAAKTFGELVDTKRTHQLDTLIDLVAAVGADAPESLTFLEDPKRTQGLWSVPLQQRCEHFKTLARLDSARDARTLLADLDKPMPAEEVPVRVELMARLIVSRKMESSFVSTWEVQSDYRALAGSDPAQAIEALKHAQDAAVLHGGLKHVPLLAQGVLGGWDPQLLCRTVTTMAKSSSDMVPHLKALFTARPAAESAALYVELMTTLASQSLVGQAPTAFPVVTTNQDVKDIGLLAVHMRREGHAPRTAEIFVELKQRFPGEAFAPAFKEALAALALGQSPDDLLRSAGTASALEQKDGKLRVGTVLIKTRGN